MYRFFLRVFRMLRLPTLGFWIVLIGCGFLVETVEAVETEENFLDYSLVLLDTRNFEFMVTDKGGLCYVIQAEEMRQYQSGNLELKGKVNVVQLDKDKDHVSVQADRLFYNKALKLCMMQGHVFVQQPNVCFSMFTEQLLYDLDQDIVSTNVSVKIQKDQSVVHGVGFFATKDFQEFSIGEPNGSSDVLLPND